MPPYLNWQKSTFSGDQANCVEVATTTDRIHIRESDAPGVVLTTTPDRLAAFIDSIKAGAFDQPS
jgi:hypothetical protein